MKFGEKIKRIRKKNNESNKIKSASINADQKKVNAKIRIKPQRKDLTQHPAQNPVQNQ